MPRARRKPAANCAPRRLVLPARSRPGAPSSERRPPPSDGYTRTKPFLQECWAAFRFGRNIGFGRERADFESLFLRGVSIFGKLLNRRAAESRGMWRHARDDL